VIIACTYVTAVAVTFIRELVDVHVTSAEQTATLECELSKTGRRVNWLKDSTPLHIDDRIRVKDHGRKHSLVISQVNWHDVGRYTAAYETQSTAAELTACCKSSSWVVCILYTR